MRISDWSSDVCSSDLIRFLPRFDADAVIASLHGATAMMGVPTFYTRLLDSPGFTRELAGNMRIFISGSAPLLPQTFAAFAERTGHAILERYGKIGRAHV